MAEVTKHLKNLHGGTSTDEPGTPLHLEPREVRTLSNDPNARYDVYEQIAKGGEAEVYKAVRVDTETGHREVVALKIFKEKNATQVARMERELQSREVLGGLDCVAQVKSYGRCSPWDELALVTEFIDGQNIQQYIEQHGRMTEEQALPVLEEILNGVKAFHRRGKLHRDISPCNVMVTEDGRVMFPDLGAVCDDERSTQTATMMGTPTYAAPEQWTSKPDERSDIFPIGVLAFYMLSGEDPGKYTGWQVPQETKQKIPFDKLREYGVTKKTISALKKMAQRDPNKRYSSVDDALAGLKSKTKKSTENSRDGEETITDTLLKEKTANFFFGLLTTAGVGYLALKIALPAAPVVNSAVSLINTTQLYFQPVAQAIETSPFIETALDWQPAELQPMVYEHQTIGIERIDTESPNWPGVLQRRGSIVSVRPEGEESTYQIILGEGSHAKTTASINEKIEGVEVQRPFQLGQYVFYFTQQGMHILNPETEEEAIIASGYAPSDSKIEGSVIFRENGEVLIGATDTLFRFDAYTGDYHEAAVDNVWSISLETAETNSRDNSIIRAGQHRRFYRIGEDVLEVLPDLTDHESPLLKSYVTEDGNFIVHRESHKIINFTKFSLTVYNVNEHTAALLDGYAIIDKRHWARENKLLVSTAPVEGSNLHTYYFVDAVVGTIEEIGKGYRGRLSGYTPIDIGYDLQDGCSITFDTVTKERTEWCKE